MSMRLLVLLGVLVGLVAAPTASAATATLTASEVPLRGDRRIATTVSPFDFVGLHWRGSGRVEFRTRSIGGGWTPWRLAVSEPHDAPDSGGNGERGPTRGWHLGEGAWVGRSNGLEVRTRGRIDRVRSFRVQSPIGRSPLRSLSAAGEPGVISRRSWQADETIVRGAPAYADSLRMVYVHHTATPNDYSPAESAAIVRAIQIYHVKGNGWNDIGYNALVDRFGGVYEGRAGGLERNVIGAHARGFNTGSFGVALIGDFTRSEPPQAALDALAGLIAWRLDLAHVDPLARLTAVSGGNERFAAGVTLPLRAVSGHRDTGATTCPGERLYRRLDELARTAAAIGLPKLYEPHVSGGLGGLVRFQARLSEPLPWTLLITDRLGREVARGSGTGSSVDWSWDSSGGSVGPYSWQMTAGNVTPAQGTLGASGPAVPEAVEIADARLEPAVISPNSDGAEDIASVTYTISANSNVAAVVVDRGGVTVAEIEAPRWRRAGEHTISFDGAELPDGQYAIRLTAKIAEGAEATFDVPVSISRTLAGARTIPQVLTPNGDGRGDELQLRFRLTREAAVRIRMYRDGTWVATPFSGVLPAGLRVVRWDGSKRVGRARDGDYEAVVEATDEVATSRVSTTFTLDATAPVVKLRASRSPARLWVSEPARLSVRVNGALRRFHARRSGEVWLRGIKEVQTLIVSARDDAGNESRLRRP